MTARPGSSPWSRPTRATSSATLAMSSAASVLPSMMRAVMTSYRPDDSIQRCDQCGAIARNLDALEARRRPGYHADITWRSAKRIGEESDQRGIGGPLARCCAHPRLEDAAAVGQPLDTVDGVSAPFRGQPHGDQNPVRRDRPGLRMVG